MCFRRCWRSCLLMPGQCSLGLSPRWISLALISSRRESCRQKAVILTKFLTLSSCFILKQGILCYLTPFPLFICLPVSISFQVKISRNLSFRKYVPLDSSLYQEVEEGKIRLWILFHQSCSVAAEIIQDPAKAFLKGNQWPKRNHTVQTLCLHLTCRESNPRKQCCDLTLVETLWPLHIFIVEVLLS